MVPDSVIHDLVSIKLHIRHIFSKYLELLLNVVVESLTLLWFITLHYITELVLKKNLFEFNSECFLQTSGTAIGTKMAPAYANNAMSIFERNLLTGSCSRPLCGLLHEPVNATATGLDPFPFQTRPVAGH